MLFPVTAFPTALPVLSRAFFAELPTSSRAFPAPSNGPLSSLLLDDAWALAFKTGATARLTMAKPTSAVSIRYFIFVESM